MLLWLIDDTYHHHEVTAATVALMPEVHFRGFMSGEAGIVAFTDAISRSEAPDVVLMDFFLGDDRGDEVTRRLRTIERTTRCVIIGYSSVSTASQVIVQAGADVILPKRSNDSGINPHLLRWLQARGAS